MTATETAVDAASATDPLILAIDVGTSSARALVYDAQARAVRGWISHRPYAVTTTPDGGVVVDADMLMGLVAACVDEILGFARAAGRMLAAVALDTFWHGVLGVDAKGGPLTPILTWADTRSASAAEILRHDLDDDAVHARTGAGLHSSYLPAKLLWLRESDPDVVKRVAWWLSFGEYLYMKLFGERRVSISMASGTGLFLQNSCEWDSELLRAIGIDEGTLSPIADYTESMSGLSSGSASRWPELAHVPWYLAVGDGAANNLGSGGTCEEHAVVMIGTSGALRVVRRAKHLEIQPRLWTYRVDAERFVQGGALSAGGNVYAWALKSLHIDDPDAVESEIARMPPDSHGLTILPFLAGERSPDWRIDAKAAIVGLTLDSRPVDILAALLEAISYRFGLVYDILRRDVPAVRGIIGSGAGLLQSPVWTQMMSDVFVHPVRLSDVPEASSRGGALLALEALGTISDADDLPAALGETYSPRPTYSEAYRRAMDRQERLYDRLLE